MSAVVLAIFSIGILLIVIYTLYSIEREKKKEEVEKKIRHFLEQDSWLDDKDLEHEFKTSRVYLSHWLFVSIMRELVREETVLYKKEVMYGSGEPRYRYLFKLP